MAGATRVAAGYDWTQANLRLANVLGNLERIYPVEDHNLTIRTIPERLQMRNDRQKKLSDLLATTAAMSLVVGGDGFVALPWLAGWTLGIGVGTVATAILASAAVGIICGYMRVRRAASLNPIRALRY